MKNITRQNILILSALLLSYALVCGAIYLIMTKEASAQFFEKKFYPIRVGDQPESEISQYDYNYISHSKMESGEHHLRNQISLKYNLGDTIFFTYTHQAKILLDTGYPDRYIQYAHSVFIKTPIVSTGLVTKVVPEYKGQWALINKVFFKRRLISKERGYLDVMFLYPVYQKGTDYILNHDPNFNISGGLKNEYLELVGRASIYSRDLQLILKNKKFYIYSQFFRGRGPTLAEMDKESFMINIGIGI